MSADEKPLRVLVVEDSETQAVHLKKVLCAAGYEVVLAGDGQKGLDAFHASTFDLILSDVMMPVMTGYQLCRAIKADPRGREVPLMLITSLGKPIDIIRGLECGADNYVNKPYEGEYLLGRIRSLLANHQLRTQTSGEDGIKITFMGETFTIDTNRPQVVDFLASSFEDFACARQREFESILARQKQTLELEVHRARESQLLEESERLRESRQFLQSTLDALSAKIAILDESGKIVAVNAAWGQPSEGNPLTGASIGPGMNYLEVCRAALGSGVAEATAIAAGIGALVMDRSDEFTLEYPCLQADPQRWFGVRATRFADSVESRVVVAHEEITTRKLAEERLLHDAFHDALTGLPNRALFMDRLECAIKRAKRQEHYTFAVLFLDFDSFKVVNDSLGHVAGDELLVAISQRLQAVVRRGDTLTRLGGDEFAILADGLKDVMDVVLLAERIREDLKTPFHLGPNEIFITASIGIALGSKMSDKPEDLLRDADTAMYHAKSSGKGRHVVFDPSMHARVVERLRIETDLRRALERQEFRVYYQPIFELKDRLLSGFEALVRWENPERGMISPAEFIPVAEETGLIQPIGLWVLRESCRQMAAWRREFRDSHDLTVSVNLSGRQLTQPDLVEQIDLILAETGLEPEGLRLEITESVIIQHSGPATNVLRRLKERGIRLSMDDFGTGYSSLSYLHHFPLDMIKIDRSFIGRMCEEDGDRAIVRTIVSLARNLGMDVVAEGVETAWQVDLLREMGCQYGQGYFFSRPVKAETAGEQLGERLLYAETAAR
jgi:diguanylate cyclase (GGDEF)-like protein